MALDRHKLKKLHSDIINGYSKFYCDLLKADIYIKHLDNFISSEVDYRQHLLIESAKEKGLASYQEKLQYLDKDGLWTSQDEKDLSDEKKFLERLKVTKTKMFLKADLNQIKFQISQAEEKVKSKESKKNQLIGLTAETYAERRINDFFMEHCTFKDKELKINSFTSEEFEDLENGELSSLISLYNDYSLDFSPLNLKKIALLPSYLNYFYLCDENPYVFYGKPVVNLTFYQAETFSHAKYFKYIMTESKGSMPEEMMNDPEKLIEWFDSAQSVKKTLSKYDNVDNLNVSLVGASSEELDKFGLSSGTKKISLAQEVAKRGGRALNMEDLLKIQGV